MKECGSTQWIETHGKEKDPIVNQLKIKNLSQDIQKDNGDFPEFDGVDLNIPCCNEKKLTIPIYPEWVEYKGEVCVSQLNFDETKRVGRPMFDLSYCMTKALNQCILKTVQFDKSKFKIHTFEVIEPKQISNE